MSNLPIQTKNQRVIDKRAIPLKKFTEIKQTFFSVKDNTKQGSFNRVFSRIQGEVKKTNEDLIISHAINKATYRAIKMVQNHMNKGKIEIDISTQKEMRIQNEQVYNLFKELLTRNSAQGQGFLQDLEIICTHRMSLLPDRKFNFGLGVEYTDENYTETAKVLLDDVHKDFYFNFKDKLDKLTEIGKKHLIKKYDSQRIDSQTLIKLFKNNKNLREPNLFLNAAGEGEVNLIELFILAEADLDYVNTIAYQDGYGYKDKDPAIVQAAKYGHVEIVKRLITAGADVNQRSVDTSRERLVYGDSALNAARPRFPEIVEMLIKAGADPASI